MAVLLAAGLAPELGLDKPKVVTFGCPRLGDERLAERVAARVSHLRVHHSGDPVPAVPSPSLRFGDVTKEDLRAYGTHGAAVHVRVSGMGRRFESSPGEPNKDRHFRSSNLIVSLPMLGRFGSVAFEAKYWHVLECYMSAFGGVQDSSNWPVMEEDKS
jgi:hypothetical protein